MFSFVSSGVSFSRRKRGEAEKFSIFWQGIRGLSMSAEADVPGEQEQTRKGRTEDGEDRKKGRSAVNSLP